MKISTLFGVLLSLGSLPSVTPGWAAAPRILHALCLDSAAPTTADMRAIQPTDYLTQALGLSSAQVPLVRAAATRRVQAIDALSRQRFASAADRSAAHTVVEYKFYNALTAALTASQFDAFLQLDDQLLAVR